jgi:hypothetical protein
MQHMTNEQEIALKAKALQVSDMMKAVVRYIDESKFEEARSTAAIAGWNIDDIREVFRTVNTK